MRVRIDFTLDVPLSDALREATQEADPAEIRRFLQNEAVEYLTEYLEGLGVRTTVARRSDDFTPARSAPRTHAV